MVTKDDVLKIAELAALSVDEEEIESLTSDLNSILEYVAQLKEVEVADIEPMSHVHGITNVLREDKVTHSLPTEEALKNAPARSGRFIKTPIIISQ